MNFFFFHPPNSPNLYCGWYRRPYYGAPRPNLSMVLCTHRAQGVLVTKMELWIPPSSSYVSNVTARLRENRLYAGWATLACPGGFWGSLYVLWMVYEVNKQVPSIKQHGRCIRACGGAIPYSGGPNLYTLLAQSIPLDGQYFVSMRFRALLSPRGGPRAPPLPLVARGGVQTKYVRALYDF